MIFQEPMTSLDPLYPIGSQIAEPLLYHRGLRRGARRGRGIVELLELVGIPEPERRIDAYPHELSGGQRQRVMIAMALANDPDVLIADEPTTALDVTVQAQILELLAELQRRLGMAIVFITHDLGIVRRFADRVYVMRRARWSRPAPPATSSRAPSIPTPACCSPPSPTGRKPPPPRARPVLLDGDDVRVIFATGGGLSRGGARCSARSTASACTCARARRSASSASSGSGKSTLGRALLRLAAERAARSASRAATLDRRPAAMRPLRRELQLVFQDPFGSLSPRMTVGEIVTEGLLVHEPALSRQRARPPRRRGARARSASIPTCATATRTSSPAASASASPSPAR